MEITKEARIGELAKEYPLGTRVLHRHGIDFCCRGGESLQEACARLRLDPIVVLEEFRKELREWEVDSPRWDEAPLEKLVKHIVTTYHRTLREELPRLDAMACRVAEVHGAKDPEVLSELAAVVKELRRELEEHMAKEEQILFPLLCAGLGPDAEGPMEVMEFEHESVERALRRLRELTGGYRVPEAACTTWRALWHGLAALEAPMHDHIHLENDILFPRARAGETVEPVSE